VTAEDYHLLGLSIIDGLRREKGSAQERERDKLVDMEPHALVSAAK
jgi:hypothetical protein